MRLVAPPHLDDWTTALVWLLAEVTQKRPGTVTGSTWEQQREGELSMDLAYRQIMRCHPLYSRFTAANAITEAELIHFLVGMAEGTARAKKTLAKVLPLGVSVEVEGLEPDLAEALKKHGLRLLPHTFQVELV